MVLDREARDGPWQRLTALQGPKKCWSETASICSGIRVQGPCFCALSQALLGVQLQALAANGIQDLLGVQFQAQRGLATLQQYLLCQRLSRPSVGPSDGRPHSVTSDLGDNHQTKMLACQSCKAPGFCTLGSASGAPWAWRWRLQWQR